MHSEIRSPDERAAEVAAPTGWSRPSVSLLAIAALYLLTLAFLPRNGFWLVDNGAKYLQMQAALHSGYASVALPWPGQDLDPEFAFNPLPYPFSVAENGKLFSVFPPVFALLSSFPYRALGFDGLYVLPLVSGVLLLAALFPLGHLLGLAPRAQLGAVWLAALGTPVWFYSVCFWEHTAAACLAVWALVAGFRYAASDRWTALAAAAVLAALAIYLRDEMYLYLPVLLGAVLLQIPAGRRFRTALVFTGVATLALVPLWALTFHYTGHLLGFHLGEHFTSSGGVLAHLQERGTVFYRLFAALDITVAHRLAGLPVAEYDPRQRPQDAFSVLLALPYLALLLCFPRLRPNSFRRALPAACGLALLSFSVTMLGHAATGGPLNGPFWQLVNANSLFSASPLLIAAFVRPLSEPEAFRRRVVWGVLLAYGCLYGLAAPEQGTFSLHWGSRFFLFFYPLLALLCVAHLAEWLGDRPSLPARALCLTVLLASVGAQLYSVHLLYRSMEFSDRLNAAVARHPEDTIITNTWHTAMDLHRVFYRKRIFLVTTRPEWAKLQPRLVAAGVRRVLMIEGVSDHPRAVHNSLVEVVSDNGLKLRACRMRVVDVVPVVR